MKLIAVACFALLGVVCLANVQDEAPKMEKPGEHHDHLKAHVGEWDVTIKMHMNPDNPMEGKGTETIKMQKGGFWLIGDHKGEFMGMPFYGHMVLGYDQHKKTYTGIWVDSYGSYMGTYTGSCKDDGKTLDLSLTAYNPMTKKDAKWRQVIKMDGEDKRSFKMYEIGEDGKEKLMMDAKYTRKKDKKKDK